ncbi:uncharacterized protein PV07_09628 [Cladophialophora immunda]|uniref:Transcription factor domain-containing protein n=1 Tax=Cladophialophora immunda TaxID=569365 RepID=A0A0D1ZFG5_9EURO|nr:uncharacterized protein PV07_09628 [Cladophialophora immunda]KIW26541.1 hypothetical protein PV07_09628 [Cladophialophora immunda]
MDRGRRQREMTEKIKAQIKRHADARRGRQTAQATSDDPGAPNFIIESGQATSHKPAGGGQPPVHTRHPNITTSSSTTEADRGQWMASVLGFLDEYEQVHDRHPMLAWGRDFDIDFLAKYLDYVFPLLFPFYRPGFQETGRSWVLALLRRSRVAFHSVMSLSAYFFIFTLIETYPGQHGACKHQLWEKVGRQTDMCFEMIQHDIHDLRLRGPQSTVVEKARVMESISQFLMFEIALSSAADWNLHLTPALALFEEIWHSDTTTGSAPKLLAALDAIALPLRFGADHGGYYIWSPEQAGFRFFAGLLVFIDIIASTALEQPPRLLECHPHLLDAQDNGEPDFGLVPLRLSGLVGCQNWVLLAISQISVLNAWKKDMKKAASLSMIELVGRANQISRTLDDGMSTLDRSTAIPGKATSFNLRSYLKGGLSEQSTTHTRIGACAAHIYLAVVVSGWQPSNAEVRSGVSRILDLLRGVGCPDHLRTLAWPLCVAGCMSEAGDQEQEFRHLLTSMDGLSLVGALEEARKIMERVWENRDVLDSQTWDLAACFRVLGTPALLV